MNAMALTGQVLMGQSVMVKSSEVRRTCRLVRPCCTHRWSTLAAFCKAWHSSASSKPCVLFITAYLLMLFFPFIWLILTVVPTSFHIAHHHLCSWLVVGREESGLGSCSAAGSGAGTVECHGGTSWQRSLQVAGYQSQCTAWGEKLCLVLTKALVSLVTVDVFGCFWLPPMSWPAI